MAKFVGDGREQDLPSMCDGPKPGAPIHGRPVVVAVAQTRFSRVKRHSDLQREGIGPAFTGEGGLKRAGGSNPIAGEVKDGKERITLAAALEQRSRELRNDRC